MPLNCDGHNIYIYVCTYIYIKYIYIRNVVINVCEKENGWFSNCKLLSVQVYLWCLRVPERTTSQTCCPGLRSVELPVRASL